MFFTTLDIIAIAWFIITAFSYSWFTEHGPLKDKTLSAHMNERRESWLRVTLDRDLRIVDTSIVTGLQNGTAFFASASLLGIGACFAMLRSSNEIYSLLEELPFSSSNSQAEWQFKVFCLLIVFAYAFFKFGWSHRLWNYTSILVGALPLAEHKNKDKEKTEEALQSALAMNRLAGRHFNRGLRTFFFSIGIIGWFVGPIVFMIATTWIIIVLIRRQFFSASMRAAQIKTMSDLKKSAK